MPSTSSFEFVDPDKVVDTSIPIAIHVNFGELQVAAIISPLGLSVMNEKVYKKILGKKETKISRNELIDKYICDVFNERYEVFRNVDIDLIIDEQVITKVTVLVVKNIPVDFVLGQSFINQVNPVFHFGSKFLKWQDKDKTIVTHFIYNRESLAAITNENSSRKAPEITIAAFKCKSHSSFSISRDWLKSEKGAITDSIEWPTRGQKTYAHGCRLTAIYASFGQVEVSAAISMSGLTVMSEKVFKKIREKSEVEIVTYSVPEEFVYDIFGQKYKVVETIVLDVTIEGKTFSIFTLVVQDLFLDMVFGLRFLNRMKAIIDSESEGLQFHHNDEVFVTPFVKNDKFLVAISNEGCKGKELPEVLAVTFHYRPERACSSKHPAHSLTTVVTHINLLYKESKETATIQSNLDAQKPEGMKKNKKQRRAENRAKKENSHLCRIGENAATVNVVYIAHDTAIHKVHGRVFGYYGALWACEPGNFRIWEEDVTSEFKSMLGYHFDAFYYVLEIACLQGIDNLLIITDNEEAVNLMETHLETKTSISDICPQLLKQDSSAFSIACAMSDDFLTVRYEYCAPTDKSHLLMEHLRAILLASMK